MLSQFLCRLCNLRRGEQIDLRMVALDADFSFRLLLDDANEFQRLACFANADTTHTERLSNLRFNGQSIGGDEFFHDYVPLGLFGGLIAEFRRLDHLVSLEGSLA